MNKVNGRHVYKGPSDNRMCWNHENAAWVVGDVENTELVFAACLFSLAPTPELIERKTWPVLDGNDKPEDVEITITATNPRGRKSAGSNKHPLEAESILRVGGRTLNLVLLYCRRRVLRSNINHSDTAEIKPWFRRFVLVLFCCCLKTKTAGINI